VWATHTTEYGARVRHLWSLIAGVVAAPVVWILVALGQSGSTATITRWAETDTFHTARLIEPAVYLAVAGIGLGLLATLRVSPLGPLAAGLLLATPYVGMFVAPLGMRSAVPGGWRLFGDPLPLRLPLDNGTLGLLGLLLMMSVFSLQRWRRWPVLTPAVPTAQPVYGDLLGPPPPPDPDTHPPTLAYPEPDLPRAGGSPWASPPSGAYRRDGTAD
jgi:hypothetical protein